MMATSVEVIAVPESSGSFVMPAGEPPLAPRDQSNRRSGARPSSPLVPDESIASRDRPWYDYGDHGHDRVGGGSGSVRPSSSRRIEPPADGSPRRPVMRSIDPSGRPRAASLL